MKFKSFNKMKIYKMNLWNLIIIYFQNYNFDKYFQIKTILIQNLFDKLGIIFYE